jgi:hypothetical protein
MFVMESRRNNWWSVLLIVGVGLLLTLPLLLNGYLKAHDFQFHLVYSQHFSAQLWQGDWYPRWLSNMNAGFGSPTFFFYAPLPYYITSFCSLFSSYTTVSFNPLGLSCALALIASGLTARLWLKEMVPRWAATIAAIFYMAWPYHLTIDLYTRFAFAEYWSFVWMPLALYFGRKLAQGRWFYFVGLALSFSLLALNHLPSFIIFMPVVIQYALFNCARAHKKTLGLRLIAAIGLMIGLSAIYWLPAMTTQSMISMDAIWTKAYYYANNFLFTGPKFEHDRYFWKYLEVFTGLTALFAGCTWWLAGQASDAATKRERHYWAIVTGCAIFMMLPLSQFVWFVLPLFQKVQFPWRFNTVITIAITALLALALPQIHRLLKSSVSLKQCLRLLPIMGLMVMLYTVINLLPVQEKVRFWGSDNTVFLIAGIVVSLLAVTPIFKMLRSPLSKPLILSLVLIAVIFLGNTVYCYKSLFVLRLKDLNSVPRIYISQGADEHRPQWVPQALFNPDRLTELRQRLPNLQVTQGQATGEIQQWQPRQLVMQVNATTASELTLRQFYYPGWQAQIQGTSQVLPSHASPLGLLQIAIPQGQYQLTATLGMTLSERIGQNLSLLSALLTLVLIGFRLRQRPLQQPNLGDYQDWALSEMVAADQPPVASTTVSDSNSKFNNFVSRS